MAGTGILSPLDDIMPPIVNNVILGFPCEDHQKKYIFQTMQKSLSKLVLEVPILASEIVEEHLTGQLYRRTPTTLKSPGPHGQVEFVFNDLTLPEKAFPFSYPELRAKGFPISELDGRVFAPQAGTQSKVMRAKANFIRGGCMLCVGISHSFADGWGLYLIMTEWARNCKIQQQLDPSPMTHRLEIPSDAPLALKVDLSHFSYEDLKQRPELWRVLGLDWRGSKGTPPPIAPYDSAPVSDTRIFNISPKALQKLKQKAAPNDADVSFGGSSWVTTNDALVAFLWRAITKARYPPTLPLPSNIRQTSHASVAIDGRNSLSIPASYIGNVVFCCMTELPLDLLRDPKTRLSTIASRIHAQVTANSNPQILRDAVALAATIPDVRALANASPSWFAEDLVTTSWSDLPFYDIDFGPIFGVTGKIETFRVPKGTFDGMCCIQPWRQNGSLDVFIGLEKDQMERLIADPEFSSWFQPVGSDEKAKL